MRAHAGEGMARPTLCFRWGGAGMCVGGELVGSMVHTVESAPTDRQVPSHQSPQFHTPFSIMCRAELISEIALTKRLGNKKSLIQVSKHLEARSRFYEIAMPEERSRFYEIAMAVHGKRCWRLGDSTGQGVEVIQRNEHRLLEDGQR